MVENTTDPSSPLSQTIHEKNPRFLVESGIEAKIANLILPLIEDLGYQLVRIRLLNQNGLTLQIMAERQDGTMTIEDCEYLSNLISPVLDVENVIAQKYHLEMSSPGIDRPLVRKSDFLHWNAHLARIETLIPVDEKRKFRGIITDPTEEKFSLKIAKEDLGEEKILDFTYDNIATAKLLLTDALIREALAKDKAVKEKKDAIEEEN